MHRLLSFGMILCLGFLLMVSLVASAALAAMGKGWRPVFSAAASLAVVLIWVYYSAQIFLMGADFTWFYAHTFGSLTEQPMAPAESVASRVQTAEGTAGSPPDDRPRPT